MSVRQFTMTTVSDLSSGYDHVALRDLPTIPRVAVSSASGVEDLHEDVSPPPPHRCGLLRSPPRVRAKHHRTLKRSRKTTAERSKDHQNDYYAGPASRSIFLQADFPSLMPLDSPLNPGSSQQKPVNFSTAVTTDDTLLPKSYKAALCDLPQPPTEVFCHIPRAYRSFPKSVASQTDSAPKHRQSPSSSLVNLAPLPPRVSHLVQFFKDKRRRITAIRKASNLNLLRRDIAKIFSRIRHNSKERRFEPLSHLLSLQQEKFCPSLDEITTLVREKKGNIMPIYCEIPADLLTPVSAYLKLSHGETHSFLFESVAGGERLGRYSFLGAAPYKVTKSGDAHEIKGDPLIPLENELRGLRYVPVKGIPSFTGGAIGYVSYDCIRHFEPRTARPMEDPLNLPESVLMYCDLLVVFDHLHQVVKVVSHYKTNDHPESLEKEAEETAELIQTKYAEVCERILRTVDKLNQPSTPLPEQGEIDFSFEYTSNKGQHGYEEMVRNLKKHILEGDIIQAVPSQRLSRPTSLHPFNIYRRLRSVNPSPYMFYVDLAGLKLIGASPETLVKVENRIVETHPIAGTRRRGATKEDDERLEKELLADEKEQAEHIMLVDLGRNDVNRVCIPHTVVVDSLMHIERYSHVMHIVSRVKGELRPEKTPFDAFRSIFPAGTVSGAPKIRAMELISEQEGEKRGVYAGAVGYFGYSGDQDTCIAIRTIVYQDGVAYLQAGAGIVHDSDPTSEYQETVSKLNSNLTAIATAERYQADLLARATAAKQQPSKKSRGSSTSAAPTSSPIPTEGRSTRSKKQKTQ